MPETLCCGCVSALYALIRHFEGYFCDFSGYPSRISVAPCFVVLRCCGVCFAIASDLFRTCFGGFGVSAISKCFDIAATRNRFVSRCVSAVAPCCFVFRPASEYCFAALATPTKHAKHEFRNRVKQALPYKREKIRYFCKECVSGINHDIRPFYAT